MLALLLLLMPVAAFAHPISQGAVDLETTDAGIHVRARVPVEEIFLSSHAATLDDAWKEHGDYLLEHFHISADGRDLDGKVSGIAETDPEHVVYDLDFPSGTRPHALSLRQDLLNELSYAPGNPWEATFVVSVRERGRLLHEGLLLTSKRPLAIQDEATGNEGMFGEYVRHGIEHILGGYDHLLFVTALALAAVTIWDLVKVIGMFTLAHSLTLTLSVLGLVRLPPAIVEPMIAGSIVFVAVTNVVWPERGRGGTRLAVAFFFGLFHGLGFAGGLLDAMSGLQGSTVGLAIVAFSLGVEIGHQMVVLPLFAALRIVRRGAAAEAERGDEWSFGALRAGSIAISVAGLFYFYTALRSALQ